MAQITWRNVNAPSFEGPLEAIGDANEDIISGFDPFKKILTDHQKLQEENFIQQGENVDIGIQANLQKLKSLGELNQAEDAGQFDIGTMEQKYGKMYSPEKLKAGISDTRTDLRADALSIASGIGTQAANDGKDITLGSKAVYENLIAKGADNDWALQQASKWEQGAGVLQNRFNKERTDFTQGIINDIPLFKNRTDLDAHISQLKSKHGNILDDKALTIAATTKFNNKLLDEADTRAKKLRAEKDITDNSFGAGVQQLLNGGSLESAVQAATNGVPGKLVPGLTSQITNAYRQFATANPREQAEFTRYIGEMVNAGKLIEANYKNTAAQLQTRIDRTELPKGSMDQAIATEQGPSGYLDAVSERFEKGLFAGTVNAVMSMFDPSITATGTKAANVVEQELKAAMNSGAINQRTALAIVNESVKLSSSSAGAGTYGLNEKDFNTNLIRLTRNAIENYNARTDLAVAQKQYYENITAHNNRQGKTTEALTKEMSGVGENYLGDVFNKRWQKAKQQDISAAINKSTTEKFKNSLINRHTEPSKNPNTSAIIPGVANPNTVKIVAEHLKTKYNLPTDITDWEIEVETGNNKISYSTNQLQESMNSWKKGGKDLVNFWKHGLKPALQTAQNMFLTQPLKSAKGFGDSVVSAQQDTIKNAGKPRFFLKDKNGKRIQLTPEEYKQYQIAVSK